MAITNFNSIQSLVESWLKSEEQGEKFPVPFDDAWVIAGYSRKDSAKRRLPKHASDKLFHISVEKSTGGRPLEKINLSCDGFKHLCLMSETEQGFQVRQYFIETEKKWKLVQQYHPEVAEDIESKRLDKLIELERLRLRSNELDHTMLTMHGKETVLALRGMADQMIETEKPTIEVIDDRHNVRFKGQTLPQIKDYLHKKHGIKFKSGAEIKRFLEQKGEGHLIAQTPRSILSEYVPEENLKAVYKLLCNDSRQLLIGE